MSHIDCMCTHRSTHMLRQRVQHFRAYDMQKRAIQHAYDTGAIDTCGGYVSMHNHACMYAGSRFGSTSHGSRFGSFGEEEEEPIHAASVCDSEGTDAPHTVQEGLLLRAPHQHLGSSEFAHGIGPTRARGIGPTRARGIGPTRAVEEAEV